MFTISILLCTAVQCFSVTLKDTFQTAEQCQQQAVVLRLDGLAMIDRGEIEPHTFDHQCVQWGRKL